MVRRTLLAVIQGQDVTGRATACRADKENNTEEDDTEENDTEENYTTDDGEDDVANALPGG
jgi:hypothetical protein